MIWFPDRDRNGSEDGARGYRHVCQVWGAWRVQNGPSPVYEPDAPPRVTEAKTGGAALGPIVFSLLFLFAVERMLEPLLLPLDKDGPTEDLVCVVRLVAS
jgi:hypothetical protein